MAVPSPVDHCTPSRDFPRSRNGKASLCQGDRRPDRLSGYRTPAAIVPAWSFIGPQMMQIDADRNIEDRENETTQTIGIRPPTTSDLDPIAVPHEIGIIPICVICVICGQKIRLPFLICRSRLIVICNPQFAIRNPQSLILRRQ